MVSIYILRSEENPWLMIQAHYNKVLVSTRVALKLNKLTSIMFVEYGSKVARYVRESDNNNIP